MVILKTKEGKKTEDLKQKNQMEFWEYRGSHSVLLAEVSNLHGLDNDEIEILYYLIKKPELDRKQFVCYLTKSICIGSLHRKICEISKKLGVKGESKIIAKIGSYFI